MNRHGQSTSEFVLILAGLTLIGILLMYALVGPSGQYGYVNVAEKIASDKISDASN